MAEPLTRLASRIDAISRVLAFSCQALSLDKVLLERDAVASNLSSVFEEFRIESMLATSNREILQPESESASGDPYREVGKCQGFRLRLPIPGPR